MNPESAKVVDRPSTRIIAYDRARALAIIGMIFVNASQMMKIGRLEPVWLEMVINFVTGRAAVIFVMLAGVGLIQAYDRSAISAKPALRRRLLLRAVLLGLTGSLLMNVWHADILHYYTAFIFAGVYLLRQPTARMVKIFLVMVLASLPVCTLAAYELGGGEIMEAFFTVGPLSPLFDYLFLGGYYPLIPWICFFLLGMLVGRLESALNQCRCRRLMAGSCVVLILIEACSALLNAETIAGRWFDIESPLWRALTASEAFPVGPLFLFSAGATGLALIALLRLLPHQPLTTSGWPGPLAALGRISLTMYIAHILIGHAYHLWIIRQYGTVSNSQTLLFAIGFNLAGIVFAMVWTRFFMRGPLELVMNTMVHQLANPAKPAWSLRT